MDTRQKRPRGHGLQRLKELAYSVLVQLLVAELRDLLDTIQR
ncbi:hypothetical protein [Aeromicrobium massiliense]|nr:hypothetical protein [Aeromicrobium massiliense]